MAKKKYAEHQLTVYDLSVLMVHSFQQIFSRTSLMTNGKDANNKTLYQTARPLTFPTNSSAIAPLTV